MGIASTVCLHSTHEYAGPMSDRRLLIVHAHPDDETIGTGTTMARYLHEGANVTLVTCTLGEEGEVLVPELAHLAAEHTDALGPHRMIELGAAMEVLGVTDWQLLGEPGRYRDSGMAGVPSNGHAKAFMNADLLAAASDLVGVIRDRRPQVLVTYDEFGGYGHPDHIQAHRVSTYAAALAGAPGFRLDLGEPWRISKFYWTAFPRSVIREGIAALKAAGDTSDFAEMDPDDIPFAVDDDLITTEIDGSGYLDVKMAALREHATQVTTDGGFFALADGVGMKGFATEYFRLVHSQVPTVPAGSARETDLFAGLA